MEDESGTFVHDFSRESSPIADSYFHFASSPAPLEDESVSIRASGDLLTPAAPERPPYPLEPEIVVVELSQEVGAVPDVAATSAAPSEPEVSVSESAAPSESLMDQQIPPAKVGEVSGDAPPPVKSKDSSRSKKSSHGSSSRKSSKDRSPSRHHRGHGRSSSSKSSSEDKLDKILKAITSLESRVESLEKNPFQGFPPSSPSSAKSILKKSSIDKRREELRALESEGRDSPDGICLFSDQATACV